MTSLIYTKLEGRYSLVDIPKALIFLRYFMFSVLKHFEFSVSFIRFVKSLYSGIQTCLKHNGLISDIFKNTRDIYQGSTQSVLLFVLSVEIMASWSISNTDFISIKINLDCKTHSVKMSQLADDTTLFSSSEHDIHFAMKENEIFGSYSGLKFNRNRGVMVRKA